jgi:type II secretory pathway pseudopilin PulG
MIQTRAKCGCRRRTNGGFTLVELLVVIGIIIILIGITLPIMHKVRVAAYKTDTANEIGQISQACTQYEETFKAYPGPLSNDEIESSAQFNTPPGFIDVELYIASSIPPYGPPLPWHITGTENLVLGLMGGLRINGKVPAFAPAEVGLGPLNLNSSNPTRTPSFMPTGANYLLWCEQQPSAQVVQNLQYDSSSTLTSFTDQAGQTAFDSRIPKFVDRFPTPGPLPILYLRARTSAKGIISDGKILDPILGITAQYQYDLREISAYTQSFIGLPTTGRGHNLQGLMAAGGTNQNFELTIGSAPPYPIMTPAILPYNAGPYFNDPTNTPSDISADANFNYTGRPHSVDQFILISAGADGIYGTPDDIVSFGDVSP